MAARKLAIISFCVASFCAGVWVWIAGCTVNVGGNGVSTSFTIGDKTVTIGLGPAGLFVVTSGVPVTHIADATGFLGGTPTDAPTAGTVRLRESSVTLRSSTTGKASVAAQGVSGSATLRWAIDAPGAVDPCTTGIDLGTFEINVAENGVISIVDEELALSVSAVSLFLENNISMCLRMEAGFDATIEISGFDVIFGPSEDPSTHDALVGTFQLRNEGLTNMHILAPGEEAGDANRLTPGLVRDSRFENLSINDLLTFRAVRDGEAIDTATCPRVNQGDFFAIVLWDGFTLTCFQPVPDDPSMQEPRQACCADDGRCFDMTLQDCLDLFGSGAVSAGAGTECASTVCEVQEPAPGVGPELQACCLGSTGAQFCQNRSTGDCVFFGGVPQGSGSTCASTTCNEPFEACCFASGVCSEIIPDRCRDGGGTPQGTGITCANGPCPPIPGPLGLEACCFDDGTCLDSTPTDCLLIGGIPDGPLSDCSSQPCPPPDEACCFSDDGTCLDLPVDACTAVDGNPQGAGTRCATTTCSTTAGCCFDDTLFCFGELSATDCMTSGGTPFPACDPDPCVYACCLSDGTCTEGLTVDECIAQGGTENARGTTCAGVTCAPAAPTRWVLLETRVNPENNSNEVVGSGRTEGTMTTYTETANSISVDDRQVDNGFEFWNISVTSTFPTPPSELIPGETVVLDVSFSHSGTVADGNPGAQFQYWVDDSPINPQFSYFYLPWSPSFSGENSTSYSFTVKSVSSGGELIIVAFWWNCSECNVYWVYGPG